MKEGRRRGTLTGSDTVAAELFVLQTQFQTVFFLEAPVLECELALNQLLSLDAGK